jgi:Secretion system C-terminal sorting domain
LPSVVYDDEVTVLNLEQYSSRYNRINNLPLADVKVYPNPAGNKVYISTRYSCGGSIFSVAGNELYRVKLLPGKNKPDISLLTPGIYILKTNTGKKVETKKIIIGNQLQYDSENTFNERPSATEGDRATFSIPAKEV